MSRKDALSLIEAEVALRIQGFQTTEQTLKNILELARGAK